MTVNTTLAHAAIKSLRHAQECMNGIEMNPFELVLWSSVEFYNIIGQLEAFIADELAKPTPSGEVIERGE